jgi:PAS domain S-box-containing protein
MLMTVVICAVDLLTPLWYEVWVLYLIPLCFMFQGAKRPYIYSAILTFLIVVGLFIPPSGSTPLMHAAANRITGILGGWGVSILLMQLKRLQISQLHMNSELEVRVTERTAQLAEANSSLKKEIDERLQAEESLRASEVKYKAIFENVQDVYYQSDANGNFAELSPSILRYSGYTREELIGKPIAGYYYEPADRLKFTGKIRESGEVIDYEVRMKTKSGMMVIASVNAHLLYDATGNFTGIEGSLRDITDRKKAEEKVQKYSYDLEQLLSISREMTSTTDLASLKRFAILAAKELLQLDFSTLMVLSEDKTRLEIEDCAGFPETLAGQFSLMEEGQDLATHVVRSKKTDIVEDFDQEKRFKVPDIVRKNNIHSAISVPMMVENSVFGVLIGHTLAKRQFSQEDISLYQSIANQTAIAMKNAINLEALRKGEKKLHDITSHMAEGIYVTVPSGRVIFINEEAIRLLGWTQTELNERGAHELVHCQRADGTPLPIEACGMQNVMNTGKRYVSSGEVFVRRDGTVFPVSVVSSPIVEGGQVVASITAFRDITERKKLELEASKAEKLESIGILAGGIAHDFNNLIQGILGCISLAKSRSYSNDKRKDLLTYAEKSCMAATELSDRLLTFSSGGEPIRKALSIPELLQDIVAGSIKSDAITAEISLASDLSSVSADERQLRQVFRNLLNNAGEAMSAGGLLRITGGNITLSGDEALSLKSGPYVRISIIDQGFGIPKEHLSKIFDPYFTTKDMGNNKGMGLGLSICFSIIRKHDGAITIESQPGKGTTATIYLPITGGQYSDEEPRTACSSASNIKRVLLMDDDASIRSVAAEMLNHLGVDVVTAENGEEAVTLYMRAQETGQGIDVVILDLVVPGGMGAQATMRKLLEIHPDVKGVVTSGYTEDPILINYRNYGFLSAIAKPYDLEKLGTMLNKL